MEREMKIVICIIMAVILTACTLSFQNISTHGTATDLVDEEQATSPNIAPNLVIPTGAL